ncbi:MAG TPA: DUF2520 domain-containing protein [Acidimicrobiales bacterium]|jgi:predicted short-subunit dehydrogenase-like oxidoreductase (DUF2520 family)|nr:DUF2520 domain-containing protein [Acidimicrobiales bacterium]
MSHTVRIVGGGRAGTAFAAALADAGWSVAGVMGRDDPIERAAERVELVLVAVADRSVGEVARRITPRSDAVIAHVAGSLGLGVLAPHGQRAAVHPLVAIPPPPFGARRLRGAWFAVAGSTDPARSLAAEVVAALGGSKVDVADERRTEYHAAACIASNHLVALLGQVERIAASAGVPFAAYLDLVRSTVDSVVELGPADALTGPVARGDWPTVAAHLAALDPTERSAYDALARQARRLVDPAFDPIGVPPWS